MSDETKCRACGKYNGPDDSSDSCHCPQVRDMDVSEDTPTPPTPDPRERGVQVCVNLQCPQGHVRTITTSCACTPAREVTVTKAMAVAAYWQHAEENGDRAHPGDAIAPAPDASDIAEWKRILTAALTPDAP